jgi:hypothetical protein
MFIYYLNEINKRNFSYTVFVILLDQNIRGRGMPLRYSYGEGGMYRQEYSETIKLVFM